MKRILHITGGMDRAGAETMIMNLYRAIDRSKFQFDFLYFTDSICDYDKEIEELGGKIYRLTATNPLKRMKATQTLLQNNPQWRTVHCHMLFSNAFHLYAAYKAGIKQRISHSHNTSDQSKNKLISKIYHGLSREFQIRYATDFVACGIEAGKFLFPHIKDVQIIPNSIDIDNFAQIAEKSEDYLRKEFHLTDDTLILLQIGTFGPQKNHCFSLKIAHSLQKKGIKFKLFLAGRGPLKEKIEDEVKQQGLDRVIKFLGVRSDIAELLGGSDLMLMPSLYEGFPVVLVESQAAGLPALIADTISKEVDLGVGLINFETLKASPEDWAKKIIKNSRHKNNSVEKRLPVLKQRGYDIVTNAQKLENLYIRL